MVSNTGVVHRRVLVIALAAMFATIAAALACTVAQAQTPIDVQYGPPPGTSSVAGSGGQEGTNVAGARTGIASGVASGVANPAAPSGVLPATGGPALYALGPAALALAGSGVLLARRARRRQAD